MTDKEIMFQIIYKMEPNTSYGFFGLWKDVTNPTLQQMNLAVRDNSSAHRILQAMAKKNYVTYLTSERGVRFALIRLTDRALQLKDDETWVNNVTRGLLPPKKERWLSVKSVLVWLVTFITGLAIGVFDDPIYDWIKAKNSNGKDESTIKSKAIPPGKGPAQSKALQAADSIVPTKDAPVYTPDSLKH